MHDDTLEQEEQKRRQMEEKQLPLTQEIIEGERRGDQGAGRTGWWEGR
ncbi:MAG: hypothetical protein MZW92_43605 [Comamonadaceae bacterium]|nr:hypothetical protein [Comamonadaceae bacterium]